MIYCLCGDNSVQWFIRVFEIPEVEAEASPENLTATREFDISALISGSFLSNLMQRKISFSNKRINGENWHGWWISEYEFKRLIRIIELHSSYLEYQALLKL